MRVLQIVVKNTSTLDVTLPVLGKLREQGAEITVLYCAMNRVQILRKSSFYSSVVAMNGGRELDYSAFLKRRYSWLGWPLRRVFSAAPADKLHLREMFRAFQAASSGRGWLAFASHAMRGHGLRTVLRGLLGSFLSKCERVLTPHLVDLTFILPRLDPDVVLFDSRKIKEFVGWSDFLAFFEASRTPVVLLPHAPHYRNPTGEFSPFHEGEALPEYCHHWSPMRYGEPERAVGAVAERIERLAYPGLDADWLEFLKHRVQPSPESGPKPIQCLFIIRRYVPEGEARAPGLDPFIVDYADFKGPLEALSDAVDSSGMDVEVVIKPHPSNDYHILRSDLARSSLKRWRISDEPVYVELATADLVVSLFSTILLVPAMAGVPTVVVETALQRHVHEEWPVLEDLYGGMQYYVSDLADLSGVISTILEVGPAGASSTAAEHLRGFFPDGASARAVETIRRLSSCHVQPGAAHVTD
jgi:hypothetical protein